MRRTAGAATAGTARRAWLAPALVLLLAALSIPAEGAQPKKDGPERNSENLYIRAESYEIDAKNNISVIVGNVRFMPPRSDTLITADAGIVWLKDREAYLEGNIRIYKTLARPLKPGDFDVPRPNLSDRTGLEPAERLEPAGDLDSVIESEVKEVILIDPRVAVSEAERLYVNWSDDAQHGGTLYLVKPTLRLAEAGRVANWVVTAPDAMGIATYKVPIRDADGKFTGKYEERRHYVVKNATFTVCMFKDPHTRFTATTLTRVDGDYMDVKNVLAFIGDVPVLYFPYLYKDLEYNWPWIRVILGTSSRFGMFLEIDTSFTVAKGVHVMPRVEIMGDRGLGLGLGADYKFGREKEIRGALDIFWIGNDAGTDFLADTGRKELRWPNVWPPALGPMPADIPLQVTNRYRIKYEHQQEYPKGWELDVEFWKFSDAGVYREYFDEEFKTVKAPEPHVLVKYGEDNWAVFVQISKRVDDFLTQTEYLPRIGFVRIAQPIGGGFLWTTRMELGYVRTLFADTRQRLGQTNADIVRIWLEQNEYGRPPALTLRENDTDGLGGMRFDMINIVSRPFEAGIFDFEPYAGLRTSWFQHGLNGDRGSYAGAPPPIPLPPDVAAARITGDQVLRTQLLAGIRVATELHRTYDVSDSPLLRQLFPNGMRHIVTPEVTWTFESDPSVKPASLPENDAVTEQQGLNKINFALRNRWQTKWAPDIKRIPGAPPGGEWYRRKLAAEKAQEEDPVDVFDLDMDIDFFVDPGRDNVYPRGKVTRNWSNLRADFTYHPSRRTEFFLDTEYSFESDSSSAPGCLSGLEVVSAGFTHRPSPELAYSLSYQYHFRDASLLRVAADWELDPKWHLRFDIAQKLSSGSQAGWDQSVAISRRFHEWEITLGLGTSAGQAGNFGAISIGPTRAVSYRPSWQFEPRSMAAFQVVETAR